MVQLAVETIPRSVGAGVTMADRWGIRTVAATDELVRQADALQYRFHAGPCLTAMRTRAVVRIDDIAADTRWPQWSGHAADLELSSLLSAPFTAGPTAIGAIKIYSNTPGAFDDRAARLLSLFTDAAKVLTQLLILPNWPDRTGAG